MGRTRTAVDKHPDGNIKITDNEFLKTLVGLQRPGQSIEDVVVGLAKDGLAVRALVDGMATASPGRKARVEIDIGEQRIVSESQG